MNTRSLETHPASKTSNDPDARADAAAFLAQLEGFVLGEASLGELLGWTNEQLEAHVALGDRLLSAGRPQDARVLFEGVQALDPRRTPLLARLALCHLLEGDPEGAAATLTERERQRGGLPAHDDLEAALAEALG